MRASAIVSLSLSLLAAASCAAARPRLSDSAAAPEVGLASYYASKYQGHRTASGERYDERALTASHRRLAFGTRVKVRNLENGKAVVLRINDRGPFVGGRVIDVSRRAARELGFLAAGSARVRVEVLGR